MALENKLSFIAPADSNIISYYSEKYLDCVSFTYIFPEKTRLMGLPKAVLYMSALYSNDMGVYVLLRKLDSSGKPLVDLNIPWSSIAGQGISRHRVNEIPK